jgi:hypothetical protein
LGYLCYGVATLRLDGISEVEVALQLVASAAIVLLHAWVHLANDMLHDSCHYKAYRAVGLDELLDVRQGISSSRLQLQLRLAGVPLL